MDIDRIPPRVLDEDLEIQESDSSNTQSAPETGAENIDVEKCNAGGPPAQENVKARRYSVCL